MFQKSEIALQQSIILDACSVISLYATGQMKPILACIPGQVHIATYVEAREVNTLFNPTTDDFDIPIQLDSLKEDELLHVVRPQSGAEATDAVNFAVLMSKGKGSKNTGEAITGAIAKARDWTMVTDDNDAMDFLSETPHDVVITTTLHIIQYWSQVDKLSRDQTRDALRLIRDYARYGPPPKKHPLRTWWDGFDVLSSHSTRPV